MPEYNGDSRDNQISGSSQADVIRGRGGNDELRGRGGNDTLYGGNGNDSLYGGNDNDVLLAGFGNDYLSGGYGNDYLDGGDGIDYFVGGSGADVFILENFFDFIEDFNPFFEGDRIIISTGTTSTAQFSYDNITDYLVGGYSNGYLDGGDDVDFSVGEPGADVFSLDNAVDYIGDYNVSEGDQMVLKLGIGSTAQFSYANSTDTIFSQGFSVVTPENKLADFSITGIGLTTSTGSDIF